MNKDEIYRAKVIRQFAELLESEESALKKTYRYRSLSQVCGWVFMAIALIAAFGNEPWPILTLATAFLGGIAVGFTIYFETTLKNWPIIKEFINNEAIQSEASKNA